ncbi:MAG: DnaJ domain-containing protein [Candidatus Thorarchaeota archaeon]|jgi:curved DNA-binding protein CbpA
MSYYDILGISRDSTKEQINAAYRDKARLYHPDLNKEEDAVGKFKQVTEAFETLNDPHKKFTYDKRGRTTTHNIYKPKSKPKKPKGKKVVNEPVHMPVNNGTPPNYDLWGNKLSPEQKKQWLEDLKTDVNRMNPPRAPRHEDDPNFKDAYSNHYERNTGPEIR